MIIYGKGHFLRLKVIQPKQSKSVYIIAFPNYKVMTKNLHNLTYVYNYNPFQKYLRHRNFRTSVHMLQSNTMKISTPPLPPPQSMLCFQHTHHGTRKPNAQYVPTLSRGRGGFAFGNKMYI